MRHPIASTVAALVLAGCAAVPDAADGIAIVADSRPPQVAHAMRVQPYVVPESDRSNVTAAAAAGIVASFACGPFVIACLNLLPPVMAVAAVGSQQEKPVSEFQRAAQLERLGAGLASRTSGRLATLVAEHAQAKWRVAGAPAEATLVVRVNSIALEDRGPRALHATLAGSAQLHRGEPGQGLDDKAVGFMAQGWVEPGDSPADDESIERDVDRLLHDLAVDIVREVSRNRHAVPYLK